MKCNCDYYKSGYMYNACTLMEEDGYFYPEHKCTSDYDDPYFANGGEDDAAD